MAWGLIKGGIILHGVVLSEAQGQINRICLDKNRYTSCSTRGILTLISPARLRHKMDKSKEMAHCFILARSAFRSQLHSTEYTLTVFLYN